MAGVTVKQVSKRFGPVSVLDRLNLSIKDGEFVVLVGPSGCGKTTLLRMIAGLDAVSEGSIEIDDRDVTWVAPKDRQIAMVFQSYALYPHMSVAENMSFGLKLNKTPNPEIERRVAEAARTLKIEHLLTRKPRELSGGQRQRVAMGRAIVRQPLLYLFDEPLSNLDAQLRTSMRTEIKRMHLAEKKTVIYVTHDQIEALTLADRIVAMDKGEVQQIGTPDDLYNRPASMFVASFIGSPPMSFLKGTANPTDPLVVTVQTDTGPVSLALPAAWAGCKMPANGSVVVGLRPEAFHYGGTEEGATMDILISVVEPCGAEAYVVGQIAGQEVTMRCAPRRVPALGSPARFTIDVDQIHLFDETTGRSLRP